MYTFLVAYWMLFGFGRQVQASYRYNFVPLQTIEVYWHWMRSHTRDSVINLLGNVLVFVPFGGLIPLAIGGGWWRMLAVHSAGIVVLEVAQLVSKRGSLDVDDFILNTLGAMLGYLLLTIVASFFSQRRVSQLPSTSP